MRAEEQAKQILFTYEGLTDNSVFERAASVFTVNLIIEALNITTGHLTLNRMDEYEIDKDFDYWYEVKQFIINSK